MGANKLWFNKYFRYLIIFSLLLHLVFYMVFFNVGFRNHSATIVNGLLDKLSLSPAEHQKNSQKHQDLLKKLQEIKDNGLPAKLSPRKSDFGWVFFSDEPSPAAPDPSQIPTTEEGAVAQAPTPHATKLTPEKPALTAVKHDDQPTTTLEQVIPEKPQRQEAPKEIAEQIIQPHKEPKIENTLSFAKTTLKKYELEQKNNPRTEKQLKKQLRKKQKNDELNIDDLVAELKKNPAEEELEPSIACNVDQPEISPDIQARIARIVRMQEQVSNFAQTPTVTDTCSTSTTAKIATAKVRGARAIENKNGREIIKLTKGFVENLKNEGDDLIERDGDPNKRPSIEDMKYISYESNINWGLQAAWKQNFAYNSTISARDSKAVIEFNLDEKGYVTHSELLQSTGYKDLDMIIMKNLELASPFPPLPKHFGVKNYTTGRIIHVFCSRYGA